MDPEMEKEANDLIKLSSHKHHIEYKGFLCNHMSHALVALVGLHATKDRLEEFYHQYEKGEGHYGPLEPAIHLTKEEESMITGSNWQDFLGNSLFGSNQGNDKRVYAMYRSYFGDVVKIHGVKDTVNAYLPKLMQGMLGAALHGLIHLGWGLYINYNQMVIDGFAYLGYAFRDVHTSLTPMGNIEYKSPVEILEEIRHDKDLHVPVHKFQKTVGNLIDTHHEKIAHYCLKWNLHELSTDEVLEQILSLTSNLHYFAGSSDFFILHGVTSSFGLKFILGVLETEELKYKFLQYFWLCLIYVYIARGSIPLYRTTPDLIPKFSSWDELCKATTRSSDEHKLKITLALHEFASWYPNNPTDWRKIAEETLFVKKWRY